MFPLLARDGLRVPYIVLNLLWLFLMGLPPFSFDLYTLPAREGGLTWMTKVLHLGSYVAVAVWHVLEVFVPPPSSKPDLWVVVNVILGAAGFGCCYLWCLWSLIDESGILQDLGLRKRMTADEIEKKKL